MIALSEATVKELTKAVKAEQKIKSSTGSRFLTYVVNPLFYAFCVGDKKFYATDACVGCGKCTEACITQNITLENGKPMWHGKCTHCQACISICPKNAIEYGEKAKGKWRYYLFEDGTLK